MIWGPEPQNAHSWHLACCFRLGHSPRSLLGGHICHLGGISGDLGEHGPKMPPRGVGHA